MRNALYQWTFGLLRLMSTALGPPVRPLGGAGAAASDEFTPDMIYPQLTKGDFHLRCPLNDGLRSSKDCFTVNGTNLIQNPYFENWDGWGDQHKYCPDGVVGNGLSIYTYAWTVTCVVYQDVVVEESHSYRLEYYASSGSYYSAAMVVVINGNNSQLWYINSELEGYSVEFIATTNNTRLIISEENGCGFHLAAVGLFKL